jgi:hypothetical protein
MISIAQLVARWNSASFTERASPAVWLGVHKTFVCETTADVDQRSGVSETMLHGYRSGPDAATGDLTTDRSDRRAYQTAPGTALLAGKLSGKARKE